MSALTIVFPYFMNRGMLAEQIRIWATYPARLRAQLHVVVVDDCSPKAHRLTAKTIVPVDLASYRVYRLTRKIRWNWLACRNLGAKVATTKWVLLTDIDHAVPVETLTRLVTGARDPRNAYRFQRLDAPHTWPYALDACAPYKMHNDSWLLTRDLFFDPRVGGYDETLSGCYGTSGEFRDRVLAAAHAHVVLAEPLIRYPREIIPDASTTIYTRKGDAANDDELARRKAIRARTPHWTPKHGLVPHELIYDSETV